ncbi:MAG: NAD(P)-dependent alcohol dehydrogenase [Tannerella sp.]|jgi:NADPH:quinone reductase-like Zn-dependent oxidoreductase|nr:NAD(P)-dependent alcohol dehydrogenase [Tannerella sp.]
MKGIVYTQFGTPEVLKLMDVEKPVPKVNQVLIKVKASSLTNLEYARFMEPIEGGKPPLMIRLMDKALKVEGKVIGSEVSGIVEEVGKCVTGVKKGDEIFAVTVGLQGAWAEYAVADETAICLKPGNLSFEAAAVIPVGGITALGAVRTAKVKDGRQVLVYGASGGVGQYALQLSKAYGATVTAVCSTRNLDMARSIGADYVIDYKQEDFTKTGKTYDAIIAVNGYNPIGIYKKLLNKNGIYVAIGGMKQGIMGILQGPFYSGGGKKMTASTYFKAARQKCLPHLKQLAEEGKITPFIDKVFSVKDISQAIAYIVKNHAQGKVAINMDI